jgi:Mrp family chromosome partitioning ATPase
MNDTLAEVYTSEQRVVRTPSSRPGARIDADIRRAMESVFARLVSMIDARGGIVLHITAATTGEGASTIARALAAAGGRADWCRTALIDADTITPAPVMASANTWPALLDRPHREAPPTLRHEIIDGSPVDTGVLQAPDADLPSADRLRWLFDSLRQTYQLTLLDCPPVLMAPKAASMSRLTDGVVLVVAAEQVRSKSLLKARGELENLGADCLGVIFNKQRERLPRRLARFF